MRSRLVAGGYRVVRTFGVDPRQALRTVQRLPGFLRDLRTFRRLAAGAETRMRVGPLQPCLGEASHESGVASGHYFHQDLLVARRVFARAPLRHVDVGSRVDGFVAHVAAFRPIEVLDIRPLHANVPNVHFRRADLLALPADLVGYTDSASCLHALEHVGLGRYGDRLDPDGHLKALASLHALVRPGGMLYLSVPIGPPRIEFNAHRVFALDGLVARLRRGFDVAGFSYVDDAGDLHEDAVLDDAAARSSCSCDYGCAIFELRRR